LNGSNARIYNLFVDDGRPMHLIATDSGFLAKTVSVDRLTLSPGERAEVLVDFSSGHPITILSDADPNQGPGGMMGRFRQMIARYTRKSFPVLSFAVDDRIPARITRLPDDLGGETTGFTEAVRNVRRFELNMGMGMMGRRQTNAPLFAINDKAFNLKRLDFSVPLGTSETWTIRSQMLSHPFHVHGTRFQVLSENGGPPRPEYGGWKDTVLVDGSVELKMRFDHTARPEAPFMYHCHILEHEDRGMMGQFAVV
jgi:FtsP/CotA-like multicopper oxidase with cupredoxin domain